MVRTNHANRWGLSRVGLGGPGAKDVNQSSLAKLKINLIEKWLNLYLLELDLSRMNTTQV